MVLFGDSRTVRFFASALLAHFLICGGNKMSRSEKDVTVMFAKGICKIVSIKEYEEIPENPDYETALKVIKEIQNILKESVNDRKIVFGICDVFSKYKIYK